MGGLLSSPNVIGESLVGVKAGADGVEPGGTVEIALFIQISVAPQAGKARCGDPEKLHLLMK